MRRRANAFNMIEILLALLVISIGAVSVLALFPVGMEANRDAIANDYAARSVDQFVHYLEDQAGRNWAALFPSDLFTGSPGTGIPASRPMAGETGTEDSGAPDWAVWSADFGFYRLESGGTPVQGMYRVVSETDVSGTDVVDFDGVLRVWATQLEYAYYHSASSSWRSDPIPPTVGVGLCVEISWPAQVPYPGRETRTFYYEVFNR